MLHEEILIKNGTFTTVITSDAPFKSAESTHDKCDEILLKRNQLYIKVFCRSINELVLLLYENEREPAWVWSCSHFNALLLNSQLKTDDKKKLSDGFSVLRT